MVSEMFDWKGCTGGTVTNGEQRQARKWPIGKYIMIVLVINRLLLVINRFLQVINPFLLVINRFKLVINSFQLVKERYKLYSTGDGREIGRRSQ